MACSMVLSLSGSFRHMANQCLTVLMSVILGWLVLLMITLVLCNRACALFQDCLTGCSVVVASVIGFAFLKEVSTGCYSASYLPFAVVDWFGGSS